MRKCINHGVAYNGSSLSQVLENQHFNEAFHPSQYLNYFPGVSVAKGKGAVLWLEFDHLLDFSITCWSKNSL